MFFLVFLLLVVLVVLFLLVFVCFGFFVCLFVFWSQLYIKKIVLFFHDRIYWEGEGLELSSTRETKNLKNKKRTEKRKERKKKKIDKRSRKERQQQQTVAGLSRRTVVFRLGDGDRARLCAWLPHADSNSRDSPECLLDSNRPGSSYLRTE